MTQKQKFSDQQVLESYSRTQSVWKTAAELSVCGQSVHERLKKLNAIKSNRVSAEQIEIIRAAYSKDFEYGNSPLVELEGKLGMLRSNICRIARKLGLTKRNRKPNAQQVEARKQRALIWYQTHQHPRGMLGKRHTKEVCDQMSAARKGKKLKPEIVMKIMKTKFSRYGHFAPAIKRGSWKAGWREIGGRKIFARSRWEANYARYLEWLKINGQIREWEHEPETFWFEQIKRGARSYLPDFRITENNGSIVFHEVKGWFDARSKTKIKRMAKYHPTVTLRIISADWFKQNSRKLCGIVPCWEGGSAI